MTMGSGHGHGDPALSRNVDTASALPPGDESGTVGTGMMSNAEVRGRLPKFTDFGIFEKSWSSWEIVRPFRAAPGSQNTAPATWPAAPLWEAAFDVEVP